MWTLSDSVFHAGCFHSAQAATQLQTRGGIGGDRPGCQSKGTVCAVIRGFMITVIIRFGTKCCCLPFFKGTSTRESPLEDVKITEGVPSDETVKTSNGGST